MENVVMKEEMFVFTDPWKQKACYASQGDMGKQLGQSEGRESEGKTWARTFLVISVGKARQGREDGFRIS